MLNEQNSGNAMSTRLTRRLGVMVLIATIVLSVLFLPALFPARDGSPASATLHRTIQQLAAAHLIAGALAGFGIALLVGPFRRTST